ncbi:MAG: hypothetical protein AAF394_04425 [Planctomycetota bacterium]
MIATRLLSLALISFVCAFAQAQDTDLDLPADADQWQVMRKEWFSTLRKDLLGDRNKGKLGREAKLVFDAEHDGVALRALEFSTTGAKDQSSKASQLFIAGRADLQDFDLVVLNPLDEKGWNEFQATYRVGFEKQLASDDLPEPDAKSFGQTAGMFHSFKWAMAYVRVPGSDDGSKVEEKQQIADQVWAIRRAVQTLRSDGGMKDVALWMQGTGTTSAATLLASVFEDDVTRLDLYNLPVDSSDESEKLLGSSIKMQQVVALAAEKSRVVIYQDGKEHWEFVEALAEKLGWENGLQLREIPKFDR